MMCFVALLLNEFLFSYQFHLRIVQLYYYIFWLIFLRYLTPF